MSEFTVTCTLEVNIPTKPLLFKITVDDKDVFFVNTSETTYNIAFDVPEDGNDHSIKFIMAGKTDDHAETDDNNDVIDSAQVEIKHISIAGVDITGLLMYETSKTPSLFIEYTHDGNGYDNKVTVPFSSVMGYNGVAEFKISSPVHLWVLEHM